MASRPTELTAYFATEFSPALCPCWQYSPDPDGDSTIGNNFASDQSFIGPGRVVHGIRRRALVRVSRERATGRVTTVSHPPKPTGPSGGECAFSHREPEEKGGTSPPTDLQSHVFRRSHHVRLQSRRAPCGRRRCGWILAVGGRRGRSIVRVDSSHRALAPRPGLLNSS
jgi:hypothetical protein